MTPSGATYKGVLQLEATFIDVKNMHLHRDSNPGLWSCFKSIYFSDMRFETPTLGQSATVQPFLL